MSVVSFRISKREREQLREWTKLRGYQSISELIRAQMGFTPLLDKKTFTDADRLDNIDNLTAVVMQILDREDELKRVVNRIALAVGARVTARDSKLIDYVKEEVERSGWEALTADYQNEPFRQPEKPSKLPAGFDR